MQNNNICAPGKYDAENDTCFDLNQLIELVKAYNRYVAKSRLNPKLDNAKGDLINIKSDKKFLLKELHDRFSDVCAGNEICITHQKFMNDIVSTEYYNEIVDGTFRPSGPDGADEWLSNVDIEQIMAQYETIHKNFKFMGAVPSNCSDLNFCSLYSLNFDKFLKKKITKLGIIFNHDRYGEPGSHWVAMFIDIANGKLYYCDSVGENPVGKIGETINNFTEYYLNTHGKKIEKKINKIEYQKDNSECGVYSCNFIIRLLAGETFDEIISRPLKFNEINSCRNVYFSNRPSKKNPNKLCDPLTK